MTLLTAELCLLWEDEQLNICICVIFCFLHQLPSTIRHRLILAPFHWKPHWSEPKPDQKERTKLTTWEAVICPAKPATAMETQPLPGYHIGNSYWSELWLWDRNNKTAINTEQRGLSVTQRQANTQLWRWIITSSLCARSSQKYSMNVLLFTLWTYTPVHCVFLNLLIRMYCMTYTLSWECVQPFKTNPTKHQTSMDDIFWAKSGQLVKAFKNMPLHI